MAGCKAKLRRVPFWMILGEFIMQRIALTFAAGILALGATAASAADLPQRPVYKAQPMPVVRAYNWAGFYIGGNIGWVWGNGTVTYLPTGGSLNGTKDNFLGGLQAGYNWQAGQFVFGVEGDWDWVNGKGCGTVAGIVSGCAQINSVATLAGRFGWAVDNVLWYGKVGAGWVNSEVNASNAAGTTFNASKTNVGLLLGGGVEVGLTPNWTAKLEYNWIDADNWTAAPGFVPADLLNVRANVQIVKGGINYKF
jgi:outer membrane immunogenic protein